MVNHRVAGMIAIALLTTTACAPTAAQGPAAIARVTIERNGARSEAVSSDETAAVCRRFRLTAADVRTYFARADRVDERAFRHDLDMSRCHASGTIRFAGGRAGRWFIDRERRGSLEIAHAPGRYFYCLTCRSAKFDEMDDESAATARTLIEAEQKARAAASER